MRDLSSSVGAAPERIPAAAHLERWRGLRDQHLPVRVADAFWRVSRRTRPGEPTQGWKLHVSATILQACDVFETLAPFLASKDVRFKAPNSLRDLIDLNAGLKYGYWQVGKFVTIYPPGKVDALRLATELHAMTRDYVVVAVPFDNQYRPRSNVFYRYGTFSSDIVIAEPGGRLLPAVRDASDELVPDDPRVAVPSWLSDPFLTDASPNAFSDGLAGEATPLSKYLVLNAISQRGKGGTYLAIDGNAAPVRPCVVKEGRRHGETSWDGQDGYDLVTNEYHNLLALGSTVGACPRVYDAFESDGNFYLAMEYIAGKSLHELMMVRRRRFSIGQVISFAVELAKVVEQIEEAGWVWNDCKPGNIIVTNAGKIRPVDFENAYRIDACERFAWSTPAYQSARGDGDRFALGAVIHLLLTGKFYKRDSPTEIRRLRRKVPDKLVRITEELLRRESSISTKELAKELELLQAGSAAV